MTAMGVYKSRKQVKEVKIMLFLLTSLSLTLTGKEVTKTREARLSFAGGKIITRERRRSKP